MILKGSQRASGQNLAAHLLRMDDNDHVRVHELRGFTTADLKSAFKEAEAISLGTRCSQYLFSLSLSPPEQERVPVAVFEKAIDQIEDRLGLQGQPRAVVFHEKEGRRHAHCVWSRIDADTMTARPMLFFKNKLMEVSRELYLEHGWKMPDGIADSAKRDPTNFTLAEWQQAKRTGLDPRWTKQVLQDCWTHSDNRQSFVRSLEERGYFLAKGDRRGFVVLDHEGEVHSLPRMLDVKTRDVRARLGEGNDLASVEATKKIIGERMRPAIRRHVEESRDQFRERSEKLGQQKEELTQHHRQVRAKLEERQKLEWEHETRARTARLPKGLRGLWHRITGKYQEVRAGNEAEAQATRVRHAGDRQRLIEKQLEQRALLQMQFKELRQRQAERLLELRKDVGRYLRFTRGEQANAIGRGSSLDLRLQR